VAVNILVADDSVTMRRILEITFAGEDAHVVTVDSAQAAVQKAQQITPDVIFADASMPGMDGYALAAAIKGTPGLERTAVIVMASQKTPYDDARGSNAGVDDHILKPFDTQHVIDRVNQILSKPRAVAKAAVNTQQGAPAAPAAPAAAPPVARPKSATIAFGQPPMGGPPSASASMGARAPAAAPVAAVAAAATAVGGDLAGKLSGLGLNNDQVQGVLALSRDVIERVVWEVVPDLAETLIREEIRRLTQ
jgi:CheY-like chemotaxis protein